MSAMPLTRAGSRNGRDFAPVHDRHRTESPAQEWAHEAERAVHEMSGSKPAATNDLVSGRYRLLRPIGAGRVWLAHDQLLDRRVAAKEIVLPPTGSVDGQLRTMRGAHSGARLDHPGVVPVLDVVWQPGRSWIVSEYVRARSLREAAPVPVREAARIGLALLPVLRAARDADLPHGDVKPSNVLLPADGRVLLTDFGLADDPGDDLTALGTTLHQVAARQSGPLETVIEGLRAGELDIDGAEALLHAAAATGPADGGAPGRPAGRDGGMAGLDDRRTGPDGRATDTGGRVVARGAVMPGPRPPGPGASAAVRPRRRVERSTRITVGVAALLLVGTAGTAVALDSGRDNPATVTGAPPATASACGTGAGGVVVPTGPNTRPYALPAGWLWHTDGRGFVVAVPQGWTRAVDGNLTCFRDPGGSRTFTVDATARIVGSPVASFEQAEATAVADGSLPGYRRVAITAAPVKFGGAAWEYTWQPVTGNRRHERRLLLSMGPDRAYAVQWGTVEQDWPTTTAFQSLMLASLA